MGCISAEKLMVAVSLGIVESLTTVVVFVHPVNTTIPINTRPAVTEIIFLSMMTNYLIR
jgi:hypothetical protein